MGKKGKGKGDGSDFQKEDVLQAVVIADSFKKKFFPVTLEKPKVLLPLANHPIIEYTLEFLVAAGVKDIYVVCASHFSEVQKYVNNCKWARDMHGVNIKPIVASDCESVGDALRVVFEKKVIDEDFILVSGDLVSNMRLDDALKQFKERRKDKTNIMTLVMKKEAPNHRSRSEGDDMAIVYDPNTNELIRMQPFDEVDRYSEITRNMFEERGTIKVRYDLVNTHIAICGQQVLEEFEDNFDYRDVQDDLVRSILHPGENDIHGYKVHLHMISSEYATRVQDLWRYMIVSNDLAHRWTYPLVPDNHLLGRTSESITSAVARHSRKGTYKGNRVHIARSADVGEDTIIGDDSFIGAGTRITSSIIGRNVTIGENCVITGAYIWDDVQVKNGANVMASILCNDVVVGEGAYISQGCILSYSTRIGPGHSLRPDTRITTWKEKVETEDGDELEYDDDNPYARFAPVDNIEEEEWNIIDVGEGGVGVRVHLKKGENTPLGSYGSDFSHLTEHSRQRSSSIVSKKSMLKRSESLVFLSEQKQGKQLRGHDLQDVLDDDDEDEEEEEEDETAKYEAEVKATVKRAVTEGHSADNMKLEVNSLKFSFNAGFAETCLAIIVALMECVPHTKTNDHMKQLMQTVTKFLPGFQAFFVDDAAPNFIWGLVSFVTSRDGTSRKWMFPYVLKVMNEGEVIDDEDILEWANDVKENYKVEDAENEEDEVEWKGINSVLSESQAFLNWLEEEEESDEEEEEEEEEEDDE